MQIRIERSNSDSGRIKIVRLQTPGVRRPRFKPMLRAPVPTPVTCETLNPPHVAPLKIAVDDGSPAARASRARRRMRRLYERARRAAKGQARLCRADEYELLICVYRAVRCWQQEGVAEEIARELRAAAEVGISRTSSLFLVLIRSALPRLDSKRASKWGSALELADHHVVRSKRLASFLRNNGGIEGAARERAKLRAAKSAGPLR